MKTVRRIMSRFEFDFSHAHESRFDRYYSNLLRSGNGNPTADEARKDLQHRESHLPFGWPR